MGKTTGFKEYERQNKPDRPVEERLTDWEAVSGHLPDEVLHTQARAAWIAACLSATPAPW